MLLSVVRSQRKKESGTTMNMSTGVRSRAASRNCHANSLLSAASPDEPATVTKPTSAAKPPRMYISGPMAELGWLLAS